MVIYFIHDVINGVGWIREGKGCSVLLWKPAGCTASQRMNSRQGVQPTREWIPDRAGSQSDNEVPAGCAASQRMKSQQDVQPVRQWSLFDESMEIVELIVLYVVFLLQYWAITQIVVLSSFSEGEWVRRVDSINNYIIIIIIIIVYCVSS